MKQHITYEPDAEAGDYTITLHRLDKPVDPRVRCRASNAGVARLKARRLAALLGCEWGVPEEPVDSEIAALLQALDQSIPKLTRALATGVHDGHLQGLHDAEKASEKPRRGALRVIRDRQRVL